MEFIEINVEFIESLLEKIENRTFSYLIFKNTFSETMFKASCNTIKNSNLILDFYQKTSDKYLQKGEKLLLIFGVLQSLFTSIDALYNLGRSLLIDKLMININQNEHLREIKYIRNDVVGHPTYRYYDDKQVGFCILNEDDVLDDIFHYFVYTFPKNTIKIDKHNVDLLKIIDNYKKESINIIQQTKNFLDLMEKSEDTTLLQKIYVLADKYSKGYNDLTLLKEIELDFCGLLGIKNDSNNRFLWRIKLIKMLFEQEKNVYINFLIYAELRKIYSLAYKLAIRLKPKIKYKFISYKVPNDFIILSNLLIKNKKIDLNILKDSYHPLFSSMYNTVIVEYIQNSKVTTLIEWIKKYFDANNHDMLYLIGSQLKKYKNGK